MTKKEKRKAVIRDISAQRGVSMSVAAHIYDCWPRKKQQSARSKYNS